MTNPELYWAAGFFEGEGTVQCWISNRRSVQDADRRYGYLQTSAAQNDREPLDRLADVLGGKVYGPYRHRTGTYFKWFANNTTADEALAKIEPLLSVRRQEQIQVAREKVRLNRQSRPPLKTGPVAA